MLSEKRSLQIFIVLSVIYLTAILCKIESLIFYLKPVLLLPLIIAALTATRFKNKNVLAAALVFSWAGDILLLFVFRDSIYFILGLCAFLLAHIFYIILFSRELKKRGGKLALKKMPLLLIIIYLITMLLVLIPHVGTLTIPVITYAIVISAMLYMAVLLSAHWPKPASMYLFTGAISFILSDSILAFDKFYQPLPGAGFLIMATYLYAQWALVRSCVK